MSSTIISDYLGRGPLSERPIAPNVPEGCAAVYFADDVNKAYAYAGSSWREIAAPEGEGGPTIVQSKAFQMNPASGGFTLDSTPIVGNYLVCIMHTTGTIGENTADDWYSFMESAGTASMRVYMKKVEGTPSTSQTPLTGTGVVAGVVFEITGDFGVGAYPGFNNIASPGTRLLLMGINGTGTNYNFSIGSPGIPWAGLLFVVGARRANTDAGTFSGDGSNGPSIVGDGTNHSINSRVVTVQKEDTVSVTHSFSSNAQMYRCAFALIPG